MSDDRQLLELTSQEEWERKNSVSAMLVKMQRDVERGNALQRVLRAERLAANRDICEQERSDVVDCEG